MEEYIEEFYYNQMNNEKKSAYQAMKVGLFALAPSFTVPNLGDNELADVFCKLRLDHPEVFYAVEFRCHFQENTSSVEMIPEYLFDQEKIREYQKAMLRRMEKIVQYMHHLTEWEKALYVHDFICESVRYDKLKTPYSYEIIGALEHGAGVCEGIAKTAKILCNALNIWCIVAVSDSNFNADKNTQHRHAWNVVQIEGRYYHMDVTFDNTLSSEGTMRYDYFGLDDKRFFKDHEPTIYPVPMCRDDKQSYYRVRKLSFKRKNQVSKRVTLALKKYKRLTFHWRGADLTQDVFREIQTLLEEKAMEKGLHAKIKLNWSQGIFQVIFSEEIPEEDCIIQEDFLEQ